jgi:hypothetical protein
LLIIHLGWLVTQLAGKVARTGRNLDTKLENAITMEVIGGVRFQLAEDCCDV